MSYGDRIFSPSETLVKRTYNVSEDDYAVVYRAFAHERGFMTNFPGHIMKQLANEIRKNPNDFKTETLTARERGLADRVLRLLSTE